MERDSLEKERDDLVTRLWEQEKIQEGNGVLSVLFSHQHFLIYFCFGSED